MWLDAKEFLGITDVLRQRIEQTEDELRWVENASADDLIKTAAAELHITVPSGMAPGLTALQLGDKPHHDLLAAFQPHFPAGTALAGELADQVQLCRAFASPATVLDLVRTKVEDCANNFPRTAAQLKIGKNKGDVLDPFFLAANFELLSNRDLPTTLANAIAHKVLMKIEDMLGNIHQLVLGHIRGNFRVPEPAGGRLGAKETLHPAINPFPGADIGQVPIPSRSQRIRLFQVKNKTGSAKGGDGKRLGDQFRALENTYGADTFYAAVVGNTLVGHRSKGAVLRACPNTAVLVGQAALTELTRAQTGAEMLLRTYQRAFRAVAAAGTYDHTKTVTDIVTTYEAEIEAAGTDFLETCLHEAMSGDPQAMDSRLK